MPARFFKIQSNTSNYRWVLVCLIFFACSQLQAASHVHHLDDDHGDFVCASCAHDHTPALCPDQPENFLRPLLVPAPSVSNRPDFQQAFSLYHTRAPPAP